MNEDDTKLAGHLAAVRQSSQRLGLVIAAAAIIFLADVPDVLRLPHPRLWPGGLIVLGVEIAALVTLAVAQLRSSRLLKPATPNITINGNSVARFVAAQTSALRLRARLCWVVAALALVINLVAFVQGLLGQPPIDAEPPPAAATTRGS